MSNRTDYPNLLAEQWTASWTAIFHRYCCYIKYWCLITYLTYEILGGISLICRNATMRVYEAWLRIFFVLCIKTHLAACSGPPLVRDRPLGAPAFLKLAYSSSIRAVPMVMSDSSPQEYENFTMLSLHNIWDMLHNFTEIPIIHNTKLRLVT